MNLFKSRQKYQLNFLLSYSRACEKQKDFKGNRNYKETAFSNSRQLEIKDYIGHNTLCNFIWDLGSDTRSKQTEEIDGQLCTLVPQQLLGLRAKMKESKNWSCPSETKQNIKGWENVHNNKENSVELLCNNYRGSYIFLHKPDIDCTMT